MRLVLVDNLLLPEVADLDLLDVHPHLGLLSLAAVASRDGHHVEIYDPKRLIRSGALRYDATLYERAALDLLGTSPGAVGFTTLGCSFLFALGVARQLKRREPDLPILLGGPHATMLSREILERFPVFDVIVRHEAEETLPAVLDALPRRAFDAIGGVSWRAPLGVRMTPGMPRIEDLDALPLLSYDLYPVDELGLDLLRVEAGRGCPFLCTFCSTASFFQRKYRLKSAGRIVAEMDRLHERYGFVDFKLDHDLFTVDRRKILSFCEAVRGRGYRWRVSARVDCVDTALLEAMAEAGCVDLYFGIETGSRRMQEISKKKLDVGLVEPTLDTTDRLSIATTTSFITGYPEEDADDLDATLDLLGRCMLRPRGLTNPQLHILTPEPGTPLFSELGARMAYDGYATPYNALLLADDDLAHIRAHPDVFASYHHYPAALPRADHTFAVDAFDALRRAGAAVVGYALGFYGSRLSVLVGAMKRWASREGRLGDVGPALVTDFLAAEHGERHHLVSLFRQAFCVADLARERGDRAGAPVCDGGYDRDRLYTLPPRSALLGDIHDCGALLARIRERPSGAAPLEDAETGALGDLLVAVSGDVAESFHLEGEACWLLRMFSRPRTVRQVGAALGGLSDREDLGDALFEELVRRKLLVPALAGSAA